MWQMQKNKLHIQVHNDSYVLYEKQNKKFLFHTTDPFLNITCSHAVFQIVTHKTIFEKLFSDKCSTLRTTTSRHKFLVNSINNTETIMLGI
jgi:hypothetical protein